MSGELGQLVIALYYMSGTGVYIPPALVFPRKQMKEERDISMPQGDRFMRI